VPGPGPVPGPASAINKLSEEQAVASMRRASLEPLEPYPGSNRKPWRSRCSICNREVTPRLANIRSGQGGCKYCGSAARAVQRRIREDEALACVEAVGLQPLESYLDTKTPWKCVCLKCGSVVHAVLNRIRSGRGGCATCGNVKRAAAKRHPEVEAETYMIKAGLEPLEPYPGARNPWRSRCLKCGAECAPRLDNVRNGGQGGCQNCGRISGDRKRRLASEVAVVNMRAAGLEPLEPYTNDRTPWRARCEKCGREVKPKLVTIRRGQGGCNYCGGIAGAKRRRIPDAVAVDTVRTEGLEPLEQYPGADKPWRCRCLNCGATVTPVLAVVRRGQGGCGPCAGRVRIDAAAAEAVVRTAGLEPLSPYPGGVDKKWRCQCRKCGTIAAPTFRRVRSGGGCSPCAAIARGVKQRLSSDEAVSSMLAVGLEPLAPYVNANTPWLSRCLKCGSDVLPRLGTVRSVGSGCESCAGSGFDAASPAILYAITHSGLMAHKIGITGAGNKWDRLAHHRRRGWQEFNRLWFATGARARRVERAVLRRLETERGIPLSYLLAEHMPQGGHTETFCCEEITIAEVNQLIDEEAAKLVEVKPPAS
jgi:hypothetical protein